MKKIFLLLGLLIIAIVATLYVGDNATQKPTTVEEFTDFGTTVTSISNIETKPVSAADPTSRVTDITKLPEVVDIGDGMYSLDGIRSNPQANFSLVYSDIDNSYSIAILAEPVAGNRIEASKYFLELLQTDEATACTLNVYVGTVAAVNENLSGKNLGLSFCPGSMQL